MKVIWNVKHKAFLMILMAPGGRLAKVDHRNCQFQQGFVCVFDVFSKPLTIIGPPKSMPNALDLPWTLKKSKNQEFRGTYVAM